MPLMFAMSVGGGAEHEAKLLLPRAVELSLRASTTTDTVLARRICYPIRRREKEALTTKQAASSHTAQNFSCN